MITVAIIEDDLDIMEVLSVYIQNEGFRTIKASSLTEARDILKTETPDVFVLDVNLPDGTGYELAKEIRNEQDAILIFLTVNDSIDHKLAGFEVGADDYMTKPFIPKELIARIHANLKRRQITNPSQLLIFDELTIDLDQKEVYKNGQLIELFTKEKQLLFYLVENRNQVISFETLLDYIWGYEGIVDQKTLSVHISTLRRKIEDLPSKPKWIQTVRGFGYKFSV